VICNVERVWLSYLDESGNTGRRLDDPDQPVHYLVAVMVAEDRALSFGHAVLDLIGSVIDTKGRLVELHGAELFGGDGPWRGVPPARRIEIYRTALALIMAHDGVVALASIDKPRLAMRNMIDPNPHLLAMQFLVEKIDGFVQGQADPLRQRALLIADQTDEHEAFALELLNGMQRSGGPVGSGPATSHIIDTVHFVRSETNPGVQIADLVAYLLNRVRRTPSESIRPADRALHAMFDEFVAPVVRTYRQTWP
jgi:hypothetical protein